MQRVERKIGREKEGKGGNQTERKEGRKQCKISSMEEFRNYDDRNEMKSKRVECKKYMTENERLEHCDEIPH